ncbi:MAG: PEGA domain-containing protein [Patescibacteria group bacterium]
MPKRVNTRVAFTFFSAAVIIVGTLFAIRYAKGQRPTSGGTLRETGLLDANSFPTAAQVFINGKLTTATDDKLNLDPGDYQIEIRKDGYSTWQKNLRIEKELVTQTDALLFPSVPSLSPITFTGVQNVVPAPDGQKLVYFTASASAEAKNGLYLVDLSDTSPLSLQRGSHQISTNSKYIDLSKASLIWSPDSYELMVTNGSTHLLLDITKLNNLDTMSDVSLRAKSTYSSWEEEMYLKERQILTKFPPEIVQIATSSATNVYFSPDQEKMLYIATASAQISAGLLPPQPAASSQPEERLLKPGNAYVYDRKEDRNFLIAAPGVIPSVSKQLLATDLYRDPIALEDNPNAFKHLQASDSAQLAQNFRVYHSGLFSGSFQWYPDSKHLIRIQPNNISILEYDATNEITVYSGPFVPSFVYPWSNGNKLLIMTSFNQPAASPVNIYGIQLK